MTDIHGKVTTRQSVGGTVKTTSVVNGELINKSDVVEKDTASDIHGRVSTTQDIDGKIKSSSAVNGSINTGGGKDKVIKDYNQLYNKPSINGVELKGNKTSEELGITSTYYGTTAYWNNQPSLISIKGGVYVYSDYKVDEQGNNIPGIKIGDGKGYLIDAPFIDGLMYDHIYNTIIHVTQNDKDRWDEKVRCYISPTDSETVVFTTISSKGE
jgi:hypothetical protein